MGLVLKNGVLVGAANVSPIIGGVIMTGIKKIDFSTSFDKENVYGLNKQPIGRARKQQMYPNGALSILVEEWKALCDASPNRDPLLLGLFNIPIIYDNNVLPQETLNNVEFVSVGRSYNAGDGALWLDVAFCWAGLNQ